MPNKQAGELKRVMGLPHATAMVAGSDYPHQIGSLEKMIASIDSMDISSEEKSAIFGRNTERLLGS